MVGHAAQAGLELFFPPQLLNIGITCTLMSYLASTFYLYIQGLNEKMLESPWDQAPVLVKVCVYP